MMNETKTRLAVVGGATLLLTVAAAFPAGAETAIVRTLWGGAKKIVRMESKSVEMERLADGGFRVRLPKASLPKDAFAIDVIPDFMRAKKGDPGYWLQARGTYGKFDKDDGAYVKNRQLMPVYGVKKGDALWYGHVKTWRFNYDFRTEAKDGAYATFPRFRCAQVREHFPDYYSDIEVEFHRLDGTQADYNGFARAYRQYQLDRGAVRTIKDRLKDQPKLDYLSEAIVVRIQTHAAKPIPDKKTFYGAGEELPIVVHMPFGVTEEFLQAIKDAGVDKLCVCSAGWQDGGYDGRTPGHFPVGANAGGPEAFARLIERAHKLGYLFTLHATNTDGYRCSKMWSEDWICKRHDGRFLEGGLWAGGQCYCVCQRASWEGWVPEELKQMAALGVDGPHYIDVYSATYPLACSDPKHPATWEQSAEYQNRVLAESKRLMGGAASESGYDHVAGNIDYINYIERDLKTEHEGKFADTLVSGVFPVWELVYHGIILYTSDRLTQNHTRGKCLYKLEKSGDPRWMEGDGVEDPYVALKIVEFGGRPIFYTYKFADVPRIRKAWDEFVPVRHLQKEEMVSHRELRPGVFETAYGNGERTVCNYTDKPVVIEGRTVAPMGYVLLGN